MYLNNKYSRSYFNIINRAKSRATTKKEAKKICGYVEKHHIIPKVLGGLNSDDNIVFLTAREHFICHLLLTKMVEGKSKYQMDKAVNIMTVSTSKHQRQFKLSSRIFEIVKRNAALAHSRLTKGKPKHTDESKKILSIKATGRISPNKGIPMSTSQRIKMSIVAKNRPLLECPHCKKSMTHTNYFRWHGDNCKNK